MRIVKTMPVTFLKDGTKAVINAEDFDSTLHREVSPTRLGKKAEKKTGSK